MEESLSKLLYGYRRLVKLNATEYVAIRRNAEEVMDAGGTVTLVHEQDKGFRLEMTLPKRRRKTKATSNGVNDVVPNA